MQSQDKQKEGSDLDTSAAARGIWLVKVPKYLAERWQSNESSTDVGKLRIAPAKVAGGKQEVIFSLKPELDTGAGPGMAPCPLDHKFIMSPMGAQNFSVLSQTYPNAESLGDSGQKLAIEGKVTHRAECQPIADAKYMQLKRIHMLEQNKPTREIKQLDTAVVSYKPVSDHKFNIEAKRQKQSQGKRAREDQDTVKEVLFAAFEKHQYYYVKDLERITNQPSTYLKTILKEICVYNLKAPHRNMWELKPEFRCYKTPGETST